MTIKKIAFSAVVAAVYAALTVALAPISYGVLQFRVSEIMCILPFFFPFCSWGLFIGCILANIFSMYGIVDIVFGSLATLLSCICTARLGKVKNRTVWVSALACLPPVIFNGIIVGAVITFMTVTPEAFWSGFAVFAGQIALEEFVIMYVLALPIMLILPKNRFFKQFIDIMG